MILLQAYLHTYSLLKDVTIEVLLLNSYAFSQRCCLCCKHSWSSWCGI